MSFTRETKVIDTLLLDPGPDKCSKILDSTTRVAPASRSSKRQPAGDTAKRPLRWFLNVGLVLAIALTGLSRTATAAFPERSIAITIRVHNYAGLAPKTLTDMEEVATEIFPQEGVETRWVDIISTGENTQVSPPSYPVITDADIQLSVLPSVMSGRFGLSNDVVGLAPDTDAQIQHIVGRER